MSSGLVKRLVGSGEVYHAKLIYSVSGSLGLYRPETGTFIGDQDGVCLIGLSFLLLVGSGFVLWGAAIIDVGWGHWGCGLYFGLVVVEFSGLCCWISMC